MRVNKITSDEEMPRFEALFTVFSHFQGNFILFHIFCAFAYFKYINFKVNKKKTLR